MLKAQRRLPATAAVTNDQREKLPSGRFGF